MDLDQITQVRKQHGKPIPLDFFSRQMYSQPSLGRREPVLPAPYKMKTPSCRQPSNESNGASGAGGRTTSRNSKGSATSSSSVLARSRPQLGMGRQSLGGGGMYAYDDVEDEEDIQDKAQWDPDLVVELSPGAFSKSSSSGLVLPLEGSTKTTAVKEGDELSHPCVNDGASVPPPPPPPSAPPTSTAAAATAVNSPPAVKSYGSFSNSNQTDKK